MAGDSFLSKPAVFTGENCHAWSVKMETYLEAHGLWEMLEIDEVPALPEDPTIAQMREYVEEKKRMNKAKTCIHSALTDEVFTKIMTCKTVKHAWVLLKNEYEGNDRTKKMQVLNLKREFEMQKMKERESLKDYSERLKKVVNKIRLLGEELPDDRVVEKILTFFMHLKLKNKEGSTGMKVILSGCTNHMTFDESMFKENDKTVISKVKIGNGHYIEVKGKRTVAIEGPSGIKLIPDVMLVPEISQNLLSVRQLLEKGYSVIFKNNMCFITNSCCAELFSVKMKDKSFCLDWYETEFKAYPCVVSQAELWHKKLWHFHYSTLEYMQKKEIVRGMSFTGGVAAVCEICQLGKQTRLPFPVEKTWRATEKIQLIHTGGDMTQCLLFEKGMPKIFYYWICSTSLSQNEKFNKDDGAEKVDAIFVDNQVAIAVSRNSVFHGKTKHFKVKLYFVREVQKTNEVNLVRCSTGVQLADILTKGLPRSRFEVLREKIGVCSKNNKEE
nr:Retrovirus-related Pol polyprotein from transposon RE1 [Ipomoea batatas]